MKDSPSLRRGPSPAAKAASTVIRSGGFRGMKTSGVLGDWDWSFGRKGGRVICASCHGSRGQSSSPMTPSLAGQQASYIILQLKAYQEGRRRHAAMESVIS